MIDSYFILGIFSLIFILIIFLFIKLPYRHREIRERFEKRQSAYDLRVIKPGTKLTKQVGKLVKKKVDKEASPSKYSRRRYRIPTLNLPEEYYYKYYLTFETFEGYKSFTVTKEEFRKCSTNTYGFIYYHRSRFHHFEVRNRDDLNIDDMINRWKDEY